ncbi:hypothetical protein D0T84_22535 [Dysgonomonas sp. 521]|uniref:hypothetical protein n=1 Tax=Dysgonomonas sp. 521 TaxID=2302932 RepID=UPI0013D7F32E|nr:hypothetical protein [Dysgonomonas sp. 521]NDV97637.1 hypothetical protein [Dysgonomonas sp. 521]
MKIKRLIELVAPEKYNYGDKPIIETITGDIVRCEHCSGKGGYYIDGRYIDFDPDKNNGEGYYVACAICKGSGEVQPVVTVEWRAAGFIKPEYNQKTTVNDKIVLTIDDIPEHPQKKEW